MINVEVSSRPSKEQIHEWNRKLQELGLGLQSGRIKIQRVDNPDPLAYEASMQMGLTVHGPRRLPKLGSARQRYKSGNKPQSERAQTYGVIHVPWVPRNSDYFSRRDLRAIFLLKLREWGVPMPVCAEILRKPLRTVERLWQAMRRGHLPRAYSSKR